MNFKHILLTTDLSGSSEEAFKLAALESKMEGSELTLLYVCPAYEPEIVARKDLFDRESLKAWKKEYMQESEERLEELAKKHLKVDKVNIKVISADDRSTAEVVCDFAKKAKCDVIICASHGRGAIGSLVLGSVVQKIISLAPCPVLVVKWTEE